MSKLICQKIYRDIPLATANQSTGRCALIHGHNQNSDHFRTSQLDDNGFVDFGELHYIKD